MVTPVFEQPWWMDAASGGSWIAVTAGEEDLARFPLGKRRVGAMTVLSNPLLTPHVGPRLPQETGKHRVDVQRRHEMIGRLIDDLPACNVVRAALSPGLTDWLPFHWAGFTSTLGRVHRIADTSDLEFLRSELSEATRRLLDSEANVFEARPASNARSLSRFLNLRRGSRPARVLEGVYSASVERGVGEVAEAVDARGRVHAASFCVWDHEALYYIAAAWNPPPFGETSGSSALLWRWIEKAGRLRLPIVFESPLSRRATCTSRGFEHILCPL